MAACGIPLPFRRSNTTPLFSYYYFVIIASFLAKIALFFEVVWTEWRIDVYVTVSNIIRHRNRYSRHNCNNNNNTNPTQVFTTLVRNIALPCWRLLNNQSEKRLTILGCDVTTSCGERAVSGRMSRDTSSVPNKIVCLFTSQSALLVPDSNHPCKCPW